MLRTIRIALGLAAWIAGTIIVESICALLDRGWDEDIGDRIREMDAKSTTA